MNIPPKQSDGQPDDEFFIECPELFLLHLTPEQYRAKQQLYRLAYERAVEQVQRRKNAFKPPFEWPFEKGSGI